MDPKVSAREISKYESGRVLPSPEVLFGLAKVLGVSADFLTSTQIDRLDGLEFRKHSSTKARDRARAEALLTDCLERYLTVEEILGIPPALGSLEQHCYDHVNALDEIDNRADELRRAWNLGLDPVPSLCALLEENGIRVIEDDLPEQISGLTCQAVRDGNRVAEAVLVSNRMNVERKRFTLAHELAHRVIRSTNNPAIRLEEAMNRFAGAFLVPRSPLKDEAGLRRHRITYYEIIRLKHKYGVSAAAMLVRLGQVGVLPSDAVKYAFKTFARAWRKVEPEPISGDNGFGAFEKPQRFKWLVWRALGEELISPVRAAELLNESLKAVEQQITGPAVS